jgi:hypothetical protein
MIEIKRIAPKSTTDVVYCDSCCASTDKVAITRVDITYMISQFTMTFHLCDRCLGEMERKLNV